MEMKMTEEEQKKIKEELKAWVEKEESDERFLYRDFEGWPVYKKTLRELLEELGAQTFEMEGKEVFGFLGGEPFLDNYPLTLIDDGMGYGIKEMFFSGANTSKNKDGKDIVIFWRDKKLATEENGKEE